MSNLAVYRRFGRLVHGIAGLTLLLVLVGVVVRSTGSGLGCGTAGGWHDWPLCHGQLIPPAAVDAIIEFSHRALAALVSLCLLGAASWAAWDPGLRRHVGGGIALAVAILIAQIALGALTVRLLEDNQINPGFVVAHLAVAFAFFGTLVVVGLRALRLGREQGGLPTYPTAMRVLALVTVMASFFQAVVGSLVANMGAALACPEFPTCAGGILVPTLSGPIGLQIVHRLMAVALTGLIVALAWVCAGQPGGVARMSKVAVGLVAIQFLLGVLNVLLRVPIMVQALHHVMAYALFGTLLAVGYLALAGPARETRGAPSAAAATAR